MPIEPTQLLNHPELLINCPNCNHQPFESTMRGLVQSSFREARGKPYCCVICANCQEIVGWEQPLPLPSNPVARAVYLQTRFQAAFFP